MEIKNKLVATGLIAGLAIFGSSVSSAAQACQELPGKLHLVSVGGTKRGQEFSAEYELIQENRIRLNEKALETCSEGDFCVEEASIKTTFFFHPWTKVSHGSMTAVVNCLK